MCEVLILGVTDASRDPRLHRQIETLKSEYNIVVIANKPPIDRTIKFRPRKEPEIVHGGKGSIFRMFMATQAKFGIWVAIQLFIRQFLIRSIIFIPVSLQLDRLIIRRRAVSDVRRSGSRLILANDLTALPLAVWAAERCLVVFDAHEYYPGRFLKKSQTLSRRLYEYYILKQYLPRCSRLITVSNGIRDLYRQLYDGRIDVVYNAPEYVKLMPKEPSGRTRYVHHGAAIRGRNLEAIIYAFAALPKGDVLDLYLVGGDGGYLEELHRNVEKIEGVTIHPPIPMQMIVETLNTYDVGIYALPPTTENQKWALPNKIFEFVQARLAIVIGPSPEMEKLVRLYDLGIVAEDFNAESLFAAMTQLTPERITYYKKKADEAAKVLSSGPQRETIRQIISEVLSSRGL